MSSEMTIEGKVYIPSKEAAVQTGYTQDYVGQLARAGAIDARRIGGLWYIFLDSLIHYKKEADSYTPTPPGRPTTQQVESLVSFDGRDYVSAARAAEITGYTQDYVGQLAREGTILGRQIGNRWYVARDAILSHKKEKDALLGAVQAESVGIPRPTPVQFENVIAESNPMPHFTYVSQKSDLLPAIEENSVEETQSTLDKEPSETESKVEEEDSQPIPIRVIESSEQKPRFTMPQRVFQSISWSKERTPDSERQRKSSYPVIFSTLAILFVVIGAGYISLKAVPAPSSNVSNVTLSEKEVLTSSVGPIGSGFLAFIERVVAPEIVYKRREVE